MSPHTQDRTLLPSSGSKIQMTRSNQDVTNEIEDSVGWGQVLVPGRLEFMGAM